MRIIISSQNLEITSCFKCICRIWGLFFQNENFHCAVRPFFVHLAVIPRWPLTHLTVCIAGKSIGLHLQFKAASLTGPLQSNRLLSLMSPWGAQSESSLTSSLIGLGVRPDLHWLQHWGPNESKHVFQVGNTGETSLLKQTARKVNTDVWIERWWRQLTELLLSTTC